jgi:hypothetical protein
MASVEGMEGKKGKMYLTMKRETTEASGRTPPRMLAECALHQPSRLEVAMPFLKSALNMAHFFLLHYVRSARV